MQLILDHQQRLNLGALLGAQKANVSEMRAFWKLIDRFELSEEEKRAIGYKVELVNGQEAVMWDRTLKLAPKPFEVTEIEGTRLRKAIDEWPYFMTSADRLWLEPLLAQLPEAAQNGQPKMP